ncbi:hypothetical protein P4H61_21170 [Paenibacillus peoriae]|nr:hypothetical protein [Paenibacillus peoriae]MEC0184003.1 hypothetical protein [Paenibacillus peoriae]
MNSKLARILSNTLNKSAVKTSKKRKSFIGSKPLPLALKKKG